MAWIVGLSWTKGYTATTENPDGSKEKIGVHGGPFYYNPRLFGRVYIYAGFRPTPTWGPGWGDEGWFDGIARWMKRRGWGNLGVAIRRASD